jgi:hypothetical protein
MESVASGNASEFLKLASQVLPVFFLVVAVDSKMLGAGPTQEAPRFSMTGVGLMAIAEVLALFGWLLPAGPFVAGLAGFVGVALLVSVVLLSMALIAAHLRQMRAQSPTAPQPTNPLLAKLNELVTDHATKVDGAGSLVLFGFSCAGGLLSFFAAQA